MTAFISGAIVMGYFVAGLFFLRFYRETRDRLFATFGAAFWLLGVQRILLVFTGGEDGSQALLYTLRLLAFLLILWAIWDKNRRP